MIKKIIIFLIYFNIFFCISLNLNAQIKKIAIHKIHKRIIKIEEQITNNFKYSEIILDTVKTVIKYQKNKIETTNNFKKSNTIINITFYIFKNKIIYCNISEKSLKFKNTYLIYNLYFKNNKLSGEEYRYTIPYPEIGVPSETDFKILFGYNKFLNKKFKRNFSLELYQLVKQTIPENF